MPSGKDIMKVTDSFAVKTAIFCFALFVILPSCSQNSRCCLKAQVAGRLVKIKLCLLRAC